MYQTYYRKYRPKQFKFVYGQDPIVKTLKKSIKNNSISHAYLFTGPRGTGKTSCAKLLAKALNCINNVNGDACDECENCKMFNENSNPDIIEIDAASNNGVDEIRKIRNNVSLVPSLSKYKIYIIDEVHMLSIGAFNALLKTLEEPPEYIIFILATTEPQKLPNTVISRCQRYDFKQITINEIKKCLKRIIEIEDIKIEEEALDEIAFNADGGLRDAVGLLEQANMYSDEIINLNDINLLSGSISINELNSIIEYIQNQDYNNISNIIDKFENSGKDFVIIFQKLLNIFYDMLIALKTKKDKKNDFNIPDEKIYKIIDILNDNLTKIKISYQKKIVAEVTLYKLCDILYKNTENIQKSDKQANNVDNVSRETLNKKTDEIDNLISELKNIRINNILFSSSKEALTESRKIWKSLEENLNNEKFKNIVGINISSTVVAASDRGIIVTLPTNALLDKIEKQYDLNKKFFKDVYNLNLKIVYIVEDYWKQIRPEYVEKIRNKEINYIDEKQIIEKIKEIRNKSSISEFDDLIEMEG